MKRERTLWRRILSLTMMVSLVMASSSAFAVVKNISVVNAAGESVGRTSVRIVFPDGETETTVETEPDGTLIFDFPTDGDYQIIFDGGTMTVAVAGGILIPALITVGTLAAVGASGGIAKAAIRDSDGSSSAASGGAGGTGITGNYNASTSVTTNPASHPDNFATASFNVSESGGSVIIVVSGAGINATLSGSLSGNTFDLTDSSGTYAGNSNVPIRIMGTFNPTNGTWSGTMTAGGLNLPMGQPISVSFTGSHP